MQEQKKSLHVYLDKNLYKILKLELYSEDLSCGEFFNELSRLLCSRDERIVEIITEYKLERLNRNIEDLEKVKMKDVYEAIERNSPFKN